MGCSPSSLWRRLSLDRTETIHIYADLHEVNRWQQEIEQENRNKREVARIKRQRELALEKSKLMEMQKSKLMEMQTYRNRSEVGRDGQSIF